MPQKKWVFDPNYGGKKIPESKRWEVGGYRRRAGQLKLPSATGFQNIYGSFSDQNTESTQSQSSICSFDRNFRSFLLPGRSKEPTLPRIWVQ